jgi:hypothetical protein
MLSINSATSSIFSSLTSVVPRIWTSYVFVLKYLLYLYSRGHPMLFRAAGGLLMRRSFSGGSDAPCDGKHRLAAIAVRVSRFRIRLERNMSRGVGVFLFS